MLNVGGEQSWGGPACLMRFCEHTSISSSVMEKKVIAHLTVKIFEWWQIWQLFNTEWASKKIKGLIVDCLRKHTAELHLCNHIKEAYKALTQNYKNRMNEESKYKCGGWIESCHSLRKNLHSLVVQQRMLRYLLGERAVTRVGDVPLNPLGSPQALYLSGHWCSVNVCQ